MADSHPAAWKHYAPTVAPATMPLLSAKISYAVDASGSTAGLVMRKQKDFVLGMMEGYQYPASVVMWGSAVTQPTSVKETTWNHRNWGTSPDVLLRDPAVVTELKSCDMWYLLTDGEVSSPTVFAQKTLEVGMANTPVIFVIVNKSGPRPSTLNISVGVSVFASAPDAAIIYKDVDTDYIFVVAAKGAFEVLTEGFEIDLEQWDSIPRFHNEAAFKAALKSAEITGAANREDHSAIDLGRAWQAKHGCLIDVDALLAQMTPQSIATSEFLDLMEEETFGALALVCKTRGLLPNLRAWLTARKERASVVEIRDVSGAADILQQLRDLGQNAPDTLREKLRTAHQLNLEDYRARLGNSQASPLLPHVNRCLATLTLLEKSGYGADILDRRSNRAMRATLVSASDIGQQLTTLSLDDDVEAYRSTCPICCCDDTIMSFALKASAKPGDNTTDFALNFPLAAGAAQDNVDILSAQYVCFQCALAMHQMSPERGSMYNEPIVAVLPLTKYVGVNRAYITNCLATVLTNGLATGASGICQLFMGVLLTTMKTREWAKESEADEEIKARREGMRWMLENLVANVSCRETFDETGAWVSFDKALRWAMSNFEEEGIYSWTARYPVAGFLLLLELVGFVDGAQIPEKLRIAKLMHEIVTVYMASILRHGENKLATQRRLLKVVFTDFNADGVPRNLEDNALAINSPEAAIQHLTSWLDQPAPAALIAQIGPSGMEKYASSLQYLAFRLFSEDNHQTPKGYFQRAAESDVHLHTAITNPQELTASVVGPLFTSMWQGEARDVDHNKVTEDTIPPFVSPYGPSVLRCGLRGCPVRFDVNGNGAEAIRKARAAHFLDVYGIKDRVLNNVSGLPENTGRLAPPTSIHVNLHAGVSKSWQALDKDAKQAVLAGVKPGERVDVSIPAIADFVDRAVVHICHTSGRGDIYHKNLRVEVEWVLTSFFAALHTAAVRRELADDADLDLVQTSLDIRILWELQL